MRRLRLYLDLIRFEHTLFALPFAYGGMLLAAGGWPGLRTFLLVTLAMVGARTMAMALNRLIDWKIDALNPRTQNRHLPKGLVKPWETLFLALVGLLLLTLAGLSLNPLTARLLPVAVFFLTIYSYTKRFTWLCHYVLGLTIGAAAAGGWIAVTGSFHPTAYWLWAGVGLWIAGFDILYATQDYTFDRAYGVKSIPARFGIPLALWIARATHLTAWLAFLLAGLSYGAGSLYFLGLLLVGGLLFYEHRLVSPQDLSRVDLAFFQANVGVSLGMFLFIVLDLWM
ncbi:4-hydroxybenzoate octaprenyltransferase [Thermus scotoductus]|uniref:4-hydroxybenzoate polyprenyltransferase n=3 Tax=Bacteria TaxID=2 RepID=A0A430R8B1_THESC|nr:MULTISPECIES: menaquinone biosynthesis prenyltransferase MqnP [Thermus]ADW22032.1 putative 4-hydroxybenzoate polyprenyltransferase [Thermus scotoductus SA-01]RTG92936.1 4-hydroxybenzoate octaprenyltransferase [Thermus scotoductus]RTG94038.1 4-hydroxybenzoate octaprenyltransferase [Thermus scotoductus]RTH03607.1 4-hydroxybenzoate octaprenyltransferase [Thermus scotoductus]RTH05648.1 4-hydroxybenzoate octaprenyltransferase [Thermus scotoductus]